jgi:hypothetical protein
MHSFIIPFWGLEGRDNLIFPLCISLSQCFSLSEVQGFSESVHESTTFYLILMKVLLFQLTSSALPRSLKASLISSFRDTKVLSQNLTTEQLSKCLSYGLVDRWPLTIQSFFQKLSYRHLAQIT